MTCYSGVNISINFFKEKVFDDQRQKDFYRPKYCISLCKQKAYDDQRHKKLHLKLYCSIYFVLFRSKERMGWIPLYHVHRVIKPSTPV